MYLQFWKSPITSDSEFYYLHCLRKSSKDKSEVKTITLHPNKHSIYMGKIEEINLYEAKFYSLHTKRYQPSS